MSVSSYRSRTLALGSVPPGDEPKSKHQVKAEKSALKTLRAQAQTAKKNAVKAAQAEVAGFYSPSASIAPSSAYGTARSAMSTPAMSRELAFGAAPSSPTAAPSSPRGELAEGPSAPESVFAAAGRASSLGEAGAFSAAHSAELPAIQTPRSAPSLTTTLNTPVAVASPTRAPAATPAAAASVPSSPASASSASSTVSGASSRSAEIVPAVPAVPAAPAVPAVPTVPATPTTPARRTWGAALRNVWQRASQGLATAGRWVKAQASQAWDAAVAKAAQWKTAVQGAFRRNA